jgi:DNA-binding transcriptional ArsR family regulator
MIQTGVFVSENDDVVASLMKGLGHPVRRRILSLVIETDEPMSPAGLAEETKTKLSNISYHVRVLRSCKLVELRGTKPAGGSVRHLYSPTDLLDHPFARAILTAPGLNDAESQAG